MTTLGIDLTASSNRASTYLMLDDHGAFSSLGTFKTTDKLLDIINQGKPGLVAIGAPLSLPAGLCCLEETCSCSLMEGRKGRVAEEALAAMGIGCFYTNKRSIVRKLIYRAIEVRAELDQCGQRMIEVYPYATKVKLFNGKVPAKSNPESLLYLRRRLPEIVPGLASIATDLNHDRCDAVLTAYTGWLCQEGLTEAVGPAEEGSITIPRAPAARNAYSTADGKRGAA